MQIKGTARIGCVTLRWPCRPTLWIEVDGIRLDGRYPFYLRKSEVSRLEYSAGFFSQGVHIRHTNPSVCPDIIFRPRDPMALLAAAKEMGYATISTKIPAQSVPSRHRALRRDG